MIGARPDQGAIAFAEKLMTLLREGRFTSTYKYAVMLSLMDLCIEHSTKSGHAPSSVTTRQLAGKVVELYWPHATPFVLETGRVLQQNSDRQAKIVSLVRRFREEAAPDPSSPLSRARLLEPRRFERLVRDVEWKLVEMPLPRLQVVGGVEQRFIYAINWDKSISPKAFKDGDSFDNLIRFVGDAGDHLVGLAGLLRPLIQRDWAALVASFNRLEIAQLESFLFGVNRVSLSPIRDPLLELSERRCFYCGRGLRTKFEIDHFIPWSRFPDNGLENLVVADPGCNGNKRDHLAAADHLGRWACRNAEVASDLEAVSNRVGWERDPDRTAAVARSIYLRLPNDAMLWGGKETFVRLDRPAVRDALGID